MSAPYELERSADMASAFAKLREFAARGRWTPQDVAGHQQERLEALVRHAVASSPFYRELYGGLGRVTRVRLQDLPPVGKAEMMEHFDRFVTDQRLKLSDLQAHVETIEGDDYYLGEYRVLLTGGTTGQRGVYVYNRQEWSTVVAGMLRLSATMGLHARQPGPLRRTAIGADTPLHMSHRLGLTMDLGLNKAQRLPATLPLPQIVAAANAFQPEALHAYPSIASLLALEQLEGRLNIQPRVVLTGAEIRTADMERNIREAWGVVPFNAYGTTEATPIAFDCSLHQGLHVQEDLVILEVVDADNRRVADGTPGHKVLLTNLYNYSQPLIRFEISDMLTMSTEACPCGSPFRLISAVEGRNDDILYLRGRDGRRSPVHPARLRGPLQFIGEIKQYQVVHDGEVISLRLVLREGVSREKVARLAVEEVASSLEEMDVICPPIRLQIVNEIERDPRMGKTKVVCSVAPPKRASVA